MNLDAQAITQFSTALIMILSIVLSVFLTSSYLSRRSANYASWSIGLWLFTFGVLEEFIFSVGIYSQILIKSYLAIVALLVQFLAIGSLQLSGSQKPLKAYYAYSIAATILLLATLAVSDVGNIISNYVVFGALPLLVILSSSLITFPAAVIILYVAIVSYRRTHNRKMLSIIAGVIIVSVAGTLYIAKFPAFLYYAEFVGILLLWAGFFNPGSARINLLKAGS
ncbi:hypothetical protein IX51_10265 [uncultured archaeon]|nr:hypothetical protein IX51_10265 [uncultured archaeon]